MWANPSKNKRNMPSAIPQRNMGPHGAPRAPEGGRPPMGPMGPQGPQEGTGGIPRGTGTPPEPRGAPQKPRGHFWKQSLFGLRPSSHQPLQNPLKTVSPASGTHLNRSGLLFWSRRVPKMPQDHPRGLGPGLSRPGPAGQPACQPASLPASLPASQPACQPASLPASQPACQAWALWALWAQVPAQGLGPGPKGPWAQRAQAWQAGWLTGRLAGWLAG